VIYRLSDKYQFNLHLTFLFIIGEQGGFLL